MQNLNNYLKTLRQEFESHANPTRAQQQSDYMRNQFDYFGMTAPERRIVQRPFLLKDQLPDKSQLPALIKLLWQQAERDFQMFALDLMKRYEHVLEEIDMEWMEYAVTQKSWWDTVDLIAARMMGAYFRKFPHLREGYVRKWLESGNIWLQRSALLFQLGYKEDLDTALLTESIQSLLGSKEFFINKAIGWMLRQYSRSDPSWVTDFVNSHPQLANLSKREALRLIQ